MANFELPEPVELDLFASFKDSQGRFRTKSLFMEHRLPAYPAHFTLKKYDVKKDGKNYISMYRKYMSIADPTEYVVAKQLLGSWDHWQVLQKAKWFREELDGWRTELAIAMESERYVEMKAIVDNEEMKGSPQAIAATKWLADRYGSKKESKRGRPSKNEVEGHLKRLKAEDDELLDDLSRIGIAK